MKLFRTKTFKKDYQKLKITDQQYEKYIKCVFLLLDNEPLPPEARDHSLIGNYSGFREFHIGGDTLVICRWLPDTFTPNSNNRSLTLSRRQSLKAPFWHQKVHSKSISAFILSIIACKNNHLPGSDPAKKRAALYSKSFTSDIKKKNGRISLDLSQRKRMHFQP